MDRRDLIRRGPLALLGIAAAVIYAKPIPQPLTDLNVTYQMNDKYMKSVLEMFMRGYIESGRMREVVKGVDG